MQVVKKQRDTKDAICELYKDMISVYQEFSKDDILQQRDRLQGIYNSLFRQTIECAMFIEGYAKKSGISMFLSYNRLIKSDGSFRACLRDGRIRPSRKFSSGFRRPEALLEHGAGKGSSHCHSRCPEKCGCSGCAVFQLQCYVSADHQYF